MALHVCLTITLFAPLLVVVGRARREEKEAVRKVCKELKEVEKDGAARLPHHHLVCSLAGGRGSSQKGRERGSEESLQGVEGGGEGWRCTFASPSPCLLPCWWS